ncbi:Glutamate-1-semialdehyde 2,1-aminomutase [bacterium HR24]|nr:Glutamate-1-semialdehyde 2,1-aminomutase [bacterium HR24]
MSILEEYVARHPRSARLYERALQSFPSGVTHDVRYVTPFPVYVEHARGSRKWDVDGHELVDLVMGHGALFLGHAHPEITRAVTEQAARGTHYGACHEREVEWAEWVRRLVPSAQVVRFTNSGTEATLMALRLARSYTGRHKVIKFDYHFHGWHDAVAGARYSDSDALRSAGVTPGALQDTISVPQGDLQAVERHLQSGQVAAVILEPTGASWGTLPLAPSFLHDLRELTRRHDTVLVFDEVITGFRVSVGGAQGRYGVVPDLTCLAKIVAGGLPGGCVAGRADIMSMMAFRGDSAWDARQRVFHPGTFNANPLSAAAGSTMLSLIADGTYHRHADGLNERLVREMNATLARLEVPGCVYGLASYFHIVLGEECPRPQGGIEWPADSGRQPPRMHPELAMNLKRAMLNHGVDLMGLSGGFVSGVHTEADVDAVLEAFEASIHDLRRDGLL